MFYKRFGPVDWVSTQKRCISRFLNVLQSLRYAFRSAIVSPRKISLATGRPTRYYAVNTMAASFQDTNLS